MTRKRPKHLALLQIKQPLPAIVSVLHRISGALLFFPGLPLLLLMLQYGLRSQETNMKLIDVLSHPFSKLILLGLMWALLHHFFAGVRYLAIDLRIGSDLAGARTSAKWVLAVSLMLTLLAGVKLW